MFSSSEKRENKECDAVKFLINGFRYFFRVQQEVRRFCLFVILLK